MQKAGVLNQIDPRVWDEAWVVHSQPVGKGSGVFFGQRSINLKTPSRKRLPTPFGCGSAALRVSRGHQRPADRRHRRRALYCAGRTLSLNDVLEFSTYGKEELNVKEEVFNA
jgi:hypothetical protein